MLNFGKNGMHVWWIVQTLCVRSNLNADELADNLKKNFNDSSENKEVVNEFVSMLDKAVKSEQSIIFDVETIEGCLNKLKRSNALDIDRLCKKTLSRSSPLCVVCFKMLI